jgi:hypothetical protein
MAQIKLFVTLFLAIAAIALSAAALPVPGTSQSQIADTPPPSKNM